MTSRTTLKPSRSYAGAVLKERSKDVNCQEPTLSPIQCEEPLLDYNPNLRPQDDYNNIQRNTRQVIHNWLHTEPYDPSEIKTFDHNIINSRPLAEYTDIDEDILSHCERDLSAPNEFVQGSSRFGTSMSGSMSSSFTFTSRIPIRRQESVNKLETSIQTPVTTFNVYLKCCYFLYFRWLYHKGIYDRPCRNFTIEDVDRLITCGAIDLDLLDFPLGRTMAAYGAFKRCQQSKSTSSSWTIPKNTPLCPTEEEFSQFVTYMENVRFSNAGRKLWPFQYSVEERPEVPEDYDEIRTQEHGLCGMLQSKGISDEECLHLIKTKDETFVDPKAKSPSDVKAAQKPVSRIGLIPKLTLKTHFKRSRSVDRPEVLSAIMPSEVKMQRPWSRIPTYRLLPSKSQEGTAFSGLRRDRDEYEERTISLPPTKKARMQWRPAY